MHFGFFDGTVPAGLPTLGWGGEERKTKEEGGEKKRYPPTYGDDLGPYKKKEMQLKGGQVVV